MKKMKLWKVCNISRGFTLVELLIVIGVLGVLAGGLVIAINPAGQFARGRDATRKSDISRIQAALELYRYDNGAYPLSVVVGPINSFPAQLYGISGTMYSYLVACNAPLVGTGAHVNTTYIPSMPCDPNPTPWTSGAYTGIWNNGNYYYNSPSDGSSYHLATCLENKSDTAGREATSADFPGSPYAPASSIPGICDWFYVVKNQ